MGLMRRLAAFGTALALCLGLGGCAGQEQVFLMMADGTRPPYLVRKEDKP